MTLPNWITIFRILLIPVFVGAWLYYKESSDSGHPIGFYYWLAVGCFVTASLSDALDGFIARKFHLQSKLGATLDPLADKALMTAGLLVLTLAEIPGLVHFPLWYLVLVLGRDVLLVSGIAFLHLLHEPVSIRPHWSGKVSTALQLASIVSVLFQWESAVMPLVLAAATFTTISTLIYISRVRHIEPVKIDPRTGNKIEP